MENPEITIPQVEEPTTEQATVATPTRKGKNAEADQLMRFQTLLNTVMNAPEAKALVSAIGYTQEMLKVGEALVKEAKELLEAKYVSLGRVRALTESCKTLQHEIHREYMQHLTITRNMLSTDLEALNALKARGTRNYRFSKWAVDVEIFYANALGNEVIKTRITAKLITIKQLQATQKKFQDLMALHNEKLQLRGEAKKATQAKNQAFYEAKQWVAQLQKILRTTYLNDKGKRAILGI